MNDRLLTPEEVAERLRISRFTVMNYLRSGVLKGVKVGRVWRIEEEELARFRSGAKTSSEFAENEAPVVRDAPAALRAPAAKEDVDGRGLPEYDYSDERWLDADIAPPLPEWDLEAHPLPEGLPIKYIPGVGFVVEGKRRYGK